MRYILFAVFLGAHVAAAQTTDSVTIDTIPAISNFKRGLMVEFGVSSTVTLLPTIRSFFRANDIKADPAFSPFLTIGFGARTRRLKYSAQNGFGIKNTQTEPTLPTSGTLMVAQNTVAYYASFWVGYDLLNGRNYRLYLNAGLGGLEYGFNVYRRSNQVVPFQTILQSSQTGVISSLVLRNVGYFDINLEYAQREKRRHTVGYVARLGYRFGTYAKPYESNAFQLLNAPADRISQIYIQTLVSFSSNGDKWRIR